MNKNKFKIAVYAISKNEEKFVDRWYESIKDADEIVVLDSGSSDNTVTKLKQKNVKVYEKKIEPWRFDAARNESLKLVSEDIDICICLDLDEIMEKDWYEKIQNIWKEDTTRLLYVYNWHFDEQGNPDVTFYSEKIHSRKGYKWINPVHEILECKNENKIVTDEIIINHYPDQTKSRSSYLPLLELAVKEDPNNDRNMHYLGREYMYYGKYNECIDTLIKHLELPTAKWDAERCASMRFISRSYINLGRKKEAEMWLKLAIKEASYLRESYVELAGFYKDNERYEEAYELLKQAFLIKEKAPIYINEAFAWNEYIYELMGIVCYNLKLYPESLMYMEQALEIAPDNEEIKNNYILINNQLNNK